MKFNKHQQKEYDDFMNLVLSRNGHEKEFLQAVNEVAEAVVPFIFENDIYHGKFILTRMVEPDRVIMFRVPCVSDNGDIEEQGVEVKEESPDISDGGSGDESVEESVEEINLKELSEEEDFSKNKINVDESFSVNELKAICKNLGLQLSGNKTTLIKRIMDNQ